MRTTRDRIICECMRSFHMLFGSNPFPTLTLTSCGTRPMIPTYVQHVPDGTERGQFAAIDLGGTNLRICKVELLGNHRWTMSQTKVKVSDELKTGSAEKLFDYIAKSVHDFLSADLDQEGEKLKLGLTFSFPVDQTAIDAGALISWTKGYSCEGAEGKDIVELLQHALDRKGVHAEVVALVNDTAGTLMARAYESGGWYALL